MAENAKKKSRREFLSQTGMAAAGLTIGATAMSAKSYGRIIGANEKIRMGFIGVGNQGSNVMHWFMSE
ncbi:MAG: twin-arginine translocation signal domain-containing protein, partial [Prolixibacteraceae bacterium]|nr:twin-arginine translocation signal domain-containing protein [Prolixibacteraceae bacterium]